MKTEQSYNREDAALREARALAELSNLELGGEGAFQRAHSDFVPKLWWSAETYTPSGPRSDWLRQRDVLREAWPDFPVEKVLALVTGPLFTSARAIEAKPDESPADADKRFWPYQHAVLYLHGNAWRARTCEWCQRRFIAEHAKARFCSYGAPDGSGMTCFAAHRKQYKTENWDANSDAVNKERRRKYRAERRRESHAKRKNLR